MMLRFSTTTHHAIITIAMIPESGIPYPVRPRGRKTLEAADVFGIYAAFLPLYRPLPNW